MLVLIAGIVIFLGAHSFTTLRPARAAVIGGIGELPYRGLHSLVSLLGFGLIIWGFSLYREAMIPVWTPPVWTRHLALVLMWFAFVALACANPAPGRIRGWLRHPMLAGVMFWAFAHLLANGDAGGMLLFGAFLAWAIYDRIAVARRGDAGAPRLASFTRADAAALGGGSIAYGAMLLLHPVLIGVPVIGF
ncbi:NnrU family protein [Rhodovastum atsumiense]|uniref:NnrU family protein n=1 Tax=Rhodovastum atsumiense TaxID=504468 RepID=A0A5M6IQT3_9PROT|nr:NnrU family protein [Rhodovastum atsumiense]KAA5610297.1 NnrU family protein [Rhodovastum atsumiense]CAH2602215.1 NnrU family protein [Rhodovastum atsumiense]